MNQFLNVPAQCFKVRQRSTQFDYLVLNCDALSPVLQQDLANALPFLACGEESAAHAFSGRLSKLVAGESRARLLSIAQDELRHAAWLARLKPALPPPESHLSTSASADFFRCLVTRDAGLHFARVAALDLAVCRLLALITHRRAALSVAPDIRDGLTSIARDEARHVQVALAMARSLGISQHMQEEVDLTVATQLNTLLAPIAAGLNRLTQKSTRAPDESSASLNCHPSLIQIAAVHQVPSALAIELITHTD
jgi:rubrerythrin